jgi:hypothetical protein
MDLALWAEKADPGPREDAVDHINIHHGALGTSSLWHRAPSTALPPAIHGLGVYETWDGADLFSSAFKLASVEGPRSVRGVSIVPGLAELGAEAERVGWQLPRGGVPFMIGSGQWLYAALPSGRVLEFDLERAEPGDEFDGLEPVLQEWLNNVAS